MGRGATIKSRASQKNKTGPMIGLGLGRLRQRLRLRLQGGGWKLLKALLDAFN